MEYDYIISIGGNCDAAHHIRTCFDIHESFPLDWLILSFEGVISLFEENFADFIALDRLSLWNGTRQAIVCSERSVIFQHDFSRDINALVQIDNIVEEFPLVKEKYKRRIDRLRTICTDRKSVLFIRSWREILHAPVDYPDHCINGVPKYPFIRLLNAISNCFPNIKFQVLFVNYGEQKIDDSRALFGNVVNMGDSIDWKGSSTGWKNLLKDIKIVNSIS